MSTTTAPAITTRSTDLLVHELLVQQRAVERAEERADAIKAELIARLGPGSKFETPEAKIAIVENHTKVVDIDTLQSVAPRGFFYKVTRRVVDMPTFKALDVLGAVPAEVQAIVGEKVSAPAVRVTLKH